MEGDGDRRMSTNSIEFNAMRVMDTSVALLRTMNGIVFSCLLDYFHPVSSLSFSSRRFAVGTTRVTDRVAG